VQILVGILHEGIHVDESKMYANDKDASSVRKLGTGKHGKEHLDKISIVAELSRS